MRRTNWSMVILASALSALAALLFAPKSGKELREEIKTKAEDTKDSFKEGKGHLVEDFKQSYFEAAEEVEIELAHLDKRQRELNETIASIESDLRG